MEATKKEEKIIWDIYRELYKEAIPSADFDKLVEEASTNSRGQKDIGFMNYEIAQNTFNEILDKQLKGHRITKLKQGMIRNTVLLGCSPKFKKEENVL